jgi:hypothetical protein
LNALEAEHQRRDVADALDWADRLAFDMLPEGKLIRRYQIECDRALHRALGTLLKLRRAEAAAIGRDRCGAGSVPADLIRPAIDGEDGAVGEPKPPADAASAPLAYDLAAPSPASSEPDRDPAPQNEPRPPAGGDRIPQNEPTARGRTAAAGIPALVFTLLILVLVRLSAAFAGPVLGTGGKPYAPGDGRSGPPAASVYSELPRPLEYGDPSRNPAEERASPRFSASG